MSKPMLHTLPGLLFGGALGFVCASILVTTVSRQKVADSGSPLSGKPASSGRSPLPSGSQLAALPATGDFEEMPPAGKLELALQFRGLDTAQRQAFLRECLNRPLPERTPLLSLLLTLWAETQPSAAVDWILANLKKPESSACVNDVLRTWAARDGQSLAEWANSHSKTIDREIVNNAMTALERHSPLWFAQISAMECNHNTEWSGMRFDSLREPGAAKALSPQLAAHVAYSTDPAKLAQRYSGQGDEPQKWGWNRLFERTAIYWHDEDPAACDAWLATFPDNARQAARRLIQEEKQTNQKTSASDTDSRPSADPEDPNTPGKPPASSAGQHSESSSFVNQPTAAEPNVTDAPGRFCPGANGGSATPKPPMLSCKTPRGPRA